MKAILARIKYLKISYKCIFASVFSPHLCVFVLLLTIDSKKCSTDMILETTNARLNACVWILNNRRNF